MNVNTYYMNSDNHNTRENYDCQRFNTFQNKNNNICDNMYQKDITYELNIDNKSEADNNYFVDNNRKDLNNINTNKSLNKNLSNYNLYYKYGRNSDDNNIVNCCENINEYNQNQNTNKLNKSFNNLCLPNDNRLNESKYMNTPDHFLTQRENFVSNGPKILQNLPEKTYQMSSYLTPKQHDNDSFGSNNVSPTFIKPDNNNKSMLSDNQQTMRTLEQTYFKGNNDNNMYYNPINSPSQNSKFSSNSPLIYAPENNSTIKGKKLFYPIQDNNNYNFNDDRNKIISPVTSIDFGTMNNKQFNDNNNNNYFKDYDKNFNNSNYNNPNIDTSNIDRRNDNNTNPKNDNEYIKQDKIKNMENNLLDHTEYISILRAENEALKKERDSALSQLNSIRNRDNLWKMQYDQLMKENEDLKNRLANADRLNKEKDMIIDDLKRKIQQLQDALFEKDKEIENMKLMMQQKENELNKMISDLQGKINDLLRERDRLIRDFNNKINELNDVIKQLQKDIAELESKNAELQDKIKSINKFSDKQKKLLEELFKFYNNINKLLNYNTYTNKTPPSEFLSNVLNLDTIDEFKDKLKKIEEKLYRFLEDFKMKFGSCFPCDIACCVSENDRLEYFRKYYPGIPIELKEKIKKKCCN